MFEGMSRESSCRGNVGFVPSLFWASRNVPGEHFSVLLNRKNRYYRWNSINNIGDVSLLNLVLCLEVLINLLPETTAGADPKKWINIENTKKGNIPLLSCWKCSRQNMSNVYKCRYLIAYNHWKDSSVHIYRYFTVNLLYFCNCYLVSLKEFNEVLKNAQPFNPSTKSRLFMQTIDLKVFFISLFHLQPVFWEQQKKPEDNMTFAYKIPKA